MNPVIDFMAQRRSTVARLLSGPGPDSLELETILRAGARVPDHGKLVPWRFLTISGEARNDLGDAMAARFGELNPDADDTRLAHERELALRAPLIITVISCAKENVKIPLWEQELSAGAVCQNVLISAIALGYGAQWISEWWAYDEGAAKILKLADGERVAGFIYVGTYGKPLEERPRPDMDLIVSDWTV